MMSRGPSSSGRSYVQDTLGITCLSSVLRAAYCTSPVQHDRPNSGLTSRHASTASIAQHSRIVTLVQFLRIAHTRERSWVSINSSVSTCLLRPFSVVQTAQAKPPYFRISRNKRKTSISLSLLYIRITTQQPCPFLAASLDSEAGPDHPSTQSKPPHRDSDQHRRHLQPTAPQTTHPHPPLQRPVQHTA